MRLLIVGSNQAHAIESHYKKYLPESGMEVFSFPSADIVYRYHSKNIFNKILYKIGLSKVLKRVNQQLIKEATLIRPEAILVFKGMELYPQTLKALKQQGFFLCNYNPDHPFILAGPGSGNKNVTRSVGLYDLHFCYNSILQKNIEKNYNIPTAYLPFGYELSIEEYKIISTVGELAKACFIGNPDKTRVELLSALAEDGIELDVYGHGWDKTRLRNKSNVQLYDAVYRLEFWRKIRQYRVQLNIFRIHNEGSHNMRTFEIPAAGGVQLAPYSQEQRFFFKENQEIFFYSDVNSMIKKTRLILSMTADKINVIRNNARNRSLSSGYSYKKRAEFVGQVLKEHGKW